MNGDTQSKKGNEILPFAVTWVDIESFMSIQRKASTVCYPLPVQSEK